MRELERCYMIRQEIREIDDKICELKMSVYYPSGSNMDGMPRRSSGDNAYDRYMVRLDTLSQQKYIYTEELNEEWREVVRVFRSCGVTDEEKSIMKSRFYYGMSWQDSAKYNKCDESKCFRIYAKVRKKARSHKWAR